MGVGSEEGGEEGRGEVCREEERITRDLETGEKNHRLNSHFQHLT